MTRHREERLVAVPRQVIFDLVADVERYPEFLPMWREARVRDRAEDHYDTDQLVGFGPVVERFSTRTALWPPETIEVTSGDRLFRRFLIRWRFLEDDAGCRAVIELDWKVRNPLLQKAIDFVLPQTARMMIDAFEQRALERFR